MESINMPNKSGQLTSLEQLTGRKHGQAICYSGYREGQNPREGIYPSYAQIKEDLLLLTDWSYLRLYDCSQHAETVLSVITNENLDFTLMLGVDIAAEVSNPNCPWGAHFSEEKLTQNCQANDDDIERLIDLTSRYPDNVFSVSIGNEASVDWTDHMVPVERLVEFAQRIKSKIDVPVTFCENYVPWTNKLAPLVKVIDFISIHTYPVWEFQSIENALEYTKQNYYSVQRANPGVPIVITEAGWTTQSNGCGIETWNASDSLQAEYYQQLLSWTNSEKILTFVFEAFDEPWKGSDDPQEPEKHWGLFYEDRTPKLVMRETV
jgi:exo-beta-1,3-glucanase (GH17 family)